MSESPSAVTDRRSLGTFTAARGRHLAERVEPFARWLDEHLEQGRWGYHARMLTAPSADRARMRDGRGRESSGINLLSQDYLALSTHPRVHAAIRDALEEYGPHAGGSPCVAGETELSAQLCAELAELLGMAHIVLFPSGWAAGFGAINAFLRRGDQVLVDELAHACLHEGIAASRGTKVTRIPHLDNESVRSTLRRIRAGDTGNGVLVVTEGLFSMDSDTPDLAELQGICHEYAATLLVDQAHDIGVLGPLGRGQAAAQGMFAGPDVVTGAFSKAFATNGGFLATDSAALAQYARYFASTHMFSTALTPLQAAGALAAVRVARSPEGQRRRDQVLYNARVFREAVSGAEGTAVLGEPSPIVPVRVDSLPVCREALAIAEENGVLLHLVEFPIVPQGQARYRIQLNSAHRPDDLVHAAEVLSAALAEAWGTR
ncbi:aminotransferase class I/II-fold pyridoxal phosphate-dependent enzyme [Sciscionella sediminilitoris]|uniref:aminotransferase class I/II-fold pyridoxal phosphate-dependent enzyme n=1 Tax=Sciscionella sediminilitoris TaxID=1445613 RepID=UPI0009E7EDEC|nr:aminotransferase class I/II-fold pyridoxal phosphate-dependent enzyme [Sciscionella sp. SE31]